MGEAKTGEVVEIMPADAGAVALPATVPVAHTLWRLIEKVGTDSNADLGKMERLTALYERLEARRAEQEYSTDMNAAQSEIQAVVRRETNKQTSQMYADYADLDRDIRPIYTRYGFALSFTQKETDAPDKLVTVYCDVRHKGGHKERHTGIFPIDDTGAKGGATKTPMHGRLSTGTYSHKQLTKDVFNIVEIGEHKAIKMTEQAPISEQDLMDLEDGIKDVIKSRENFLKWLQVTAISELDRACYDKAMTEIARLRAVRGAKP